MKLNKNIIAKIWYNFLLTRNFYCDFIAIIFHFLQKNFKVCVFQIFYVLLQQYLFVKKTIMVKEKLIEMRKAKGFSVQEVAEKMCKSVSSYHRREKGQTKVHFDEWQKLAKIFNVPFEDIYEPEESQSIIFNDSSTASGNYFGTNNIYSIPESLLEAQHKYIQKLEKEIAELVKENTELKMLIKP